MSTHLTLALALLVSLATAQTTIINPLSANVGGGRQPIVYTELPPDPKAPALPSRNPPPAPGAKQALLQRVAASPASPPLSLPKPGVYDKVPNVYPPGYAPPTRAQVAAVKKAVSARASIDRLEKDSARLQRQISELKTKIDRRAVAGSKAELDKRIQSIDRRHQSNVAERVTALRLQGQLTKLRLQPSRVLTGDGQPRMIWTNPKKGREAGIRDLPAVERLQLERARSAAIKQASADQKAVAKYTNKLAKQSAKVEKQNQKVQKKIADLRKKDKLRNNTAPVKK